MSPEKRSTRSTGRIARAVEEPSRPGKGVTPTHNLAVIAPHVAAEWHQERNRPLIPEHVAPNSGKSVWWRCSKGHEWQAPVYKRTGGHGCPYCSGKRVSRERSLAGRHPELAGEWDKNRNGGLTPWDVTYGSEFVAWWKCPAGDDHEWQAPVLRRTQGYGCPCCSGHKLTLERSLAEYNPEVAAQWHSTRNGKLTPADVTLSAARVVWWRCSKDPSHEWKGKVANRRLGQGCPFCSHNRLSSTNSLAAAFPEIAADWHPTRNGRLTPDKVVAGSNRKVWWKCPAGPDHEWSTAIGNRASGTGCPFCTGNKPSVTNSLASLNPELAAEWCWERNGELTPDEVTTGSNRKVWWQCPHGPDHQWQATVAIRRTSGCPCCDGKKPSVTNCIATVAPKLAEQWHPEKNGRLTPRDVTPGSGKRVWWRCTFGHEWAGLIYGRKGGEVGCPTCWRLSRQHPVATTFKRRKQARIGKYEGAKHGPVRRMQ